MLLSPVMRTLTLVGDLAANSICSRMWLGNYGALAVEEVVDGPERCSLFAFRTCLVESANRFENARLPLR